MNTGEAARSSRFDVEAVRRDFPILHQTVNGQPLVYLDNAATTQKPEVVIDAISNYYRTINANVHRGAHTLSDRATLAFEGARDALRGFVNAAAREEIIWTRGCTESINLVASCFGERYLQAGDEILVSTLAHHSNIVPWQLAAQRCGARVVPIPVTGDSELDLAALTAEDKSIGDDAGYPRPSQYAGRFRRLPGPQPGGPAAPAPGPCCCSSASSSRRCCS